jgi:repressor LexA
MSRSAQSGPTDRQRQILAWMERFIANHGLPPTIQEIADHFGLSGPTIHEILLALAAKGLVKRADRGSRSWIPKTMKALRCACVEVPLVGVIAAGAPIEAIEERTEHIAVRRDLLRGQPGYALRIRGDSMTGAGILDGDTVIVRQQDDARDGEIVVALIGTEATLKRFHREGSGARLEPANSRHRAIHVDGADLRIQGVVVGVQRILSGADTDQT